jgi:hypothetical protein
MPKKHRNELKPWTPFQEATVPDAKWPKDEFPSHVYLNSRYQVMVYDKRMVGEMKHVSITHLSIKRLDKESIHDWRDLQRIKNELCGPEREAVELYPAESRLMDTSNQYHLWVLPEGMGFPFGYIGRAVVKESGGGAKQRPFDPDNTPPDAMSAEEAHQKFKESQEKPIILR